MPMSIIAAVYRMPFDRAGDVFGDVRNEDLSITLIDYILDEHGIDPDDVKDLIWGVAQQRIKQDSNVARIIAFLSVLDEETPATSINCWCVFSARATTSTSNAIATGNHECIVANEAESMSRAPMDGDSYKHLHPELSERYNVFQLQMGMAAEKIAEEYEASQKAQDKFTLRSHQRTTGVTDSGHFDDETIPIETTDGAVTRGEDIRHDASVKILSGLDPALSDDGSVTAGSSSQIVDGAAVVLVTSREFAEDHGSDVLTLASTNNVAGVDPTVMDIGPVPATRDLLDHAGTDIDGYDLVEVDEAFASQRGYSRRELDIDAGNPNVNGSAIASGHLLGASGACLSVTLIHEMQKRDVDHGLAPPYVNFGQGAAIELSKWLRTRLLFVFPTP